MARPPLMISRAARLAENAAASGAPIVMVRVGWSADFAEALKQPVDAQAPAHALPDNWWTYPVSLGKTRQRYRGDQTCQWGAFYHRLELQLAPPRYRHHYPVRIPPTLAGIHRP